jgi:hypothetical protein
MEGAVDRGIVAAQALGHSAVGQPLVIETLCFCGVERFTFAPGLWHNKVFQHDYRLFAADEQVAPRPPVSAGGLAIPAHEYALFSDQPPSGTRGLDGEVHRHIRQPGHARLHDELPQYVRPRAVQGDGEFINLLE